MRIVKPLETDYRPTSGGWRQLQLCANWAPLLVPLETCVMDRIVLILEAMVPFAQQLLTGVVRYSREQGKWRVLTLGGPGAPSLDYLEQIQPSGVIGRITQKSVLERVRAVGVPVVNLSTVLGDRSVATVGPGDRSIGRLGAEHLLDQGLRNLAYLGPSGLHNSELRFEGFAEGAAVEGCVVARYGDSTDPDQAKLDPSGTRNLEKWLTRLPRPCGLMAFNDHRAASALDACENAGLRVPDDVCILGVDDDDLLQATFPLPVSSIPIAAEEIGHRGCVLLDQLVRGDAAYPQQQLVGPLAVRERASTARHRLLLTAEINLSLTYLDRHFFEPIGVQEMADAAGLNRRTFERRFAKDLDESPYRYLTRLRLDLAKDLLVSNTWTLDAVGHAAGFSGARDFCALFKQHSGMTPTQFRERSAEEKERAQKMARSLG